MSDLNTVKCYYKFDVIGVPQGLILGKEFS